MRSWKGALLLGRDASGVVVGVQVVELPGTHAVELDDRLAVGPEVVVHLWRQVAESTGRDLHALRLVERVPHSDVRGPRDHGYVFIRRMPVRHDLVARRHL